jgi:hypothetical protein
LKTKISVKRKLSSNSHLHLAKHPELHYRASKKREISSNLKGGAAMALKESSSQTNGSVKTEGERLAIAKEVIIKALLPVVFDKVEEGQMYEVFDRWYGKLLNLITGEDGLVQPAKVIDTPKEVVDASKKIVKVEVRPDSPVENKATDKQIKKIFALGHNLNMGKEELEEEAFKVSGIDSLSKLSKSQASDLIDDLSAMEGVQEIYG